MKFCLSKDVQQELNELNSYRYKVRLMTRNEAIKCLKKHLPIITNPQNVIDFYIEIGMLKVEEEKTVEQKAVNSLMKNGFSCAVSHDIVSDLDAAGFKIVEKDK